MPTDRVVLVISNDPSIQATLPPSLPFDREVHVAASLEAAALMYHDLALKLGQIYLDPRTPRTTARNSTSRPEDVAIILQLFENTGYDRELCTIVDNAGNDQRLAERHAVGDRIRTFFAAPG